MGGDNKQTRETGCPGDLSCLASDEVLTDLNLHGRNATPFTVMDDGIVRAIAGGVGLVATDEDIAFLPQQVQERIGQARIAVGKDT
jgi:hypothetical protein